MKVGIAQINTVAGDFPGNARRLLHAYRECLDQDADWVLTPALSLAGGEILPRQIGSCLQALDYLGSETRATPLVVGHPGENGASMASLLVDGVVQATFTEPALIERGGMQVAIVPDGGIIPGADLVLQLARAPGKAGFPAMAGTPHVVCNAVGGDREWIYPGRSVVYSSSGEVIARMHSFGEECRVVSVRGRADDLPPMDRAADLLAGWKLGLADFVRKQGYLGVTLLLDGNAESRLLATLGREVLGDDAVEMVALSPESADGVFLATPVDVSALEAAFSAALNIRPDSPELAAFVLSTIAHRSGHLPLLATTRAGLLSGDFAVVEGLAPFGDLSQGQLADLANAAGLSFHTDSSDEEIVHAISDEGLPLEEMLKRGYPETGVLGWQRRIDRAQFRVRPWILRLGMLNG